MEQTLEEFHRRREVGTKRQARIHTDVQIGQIVQEAKDRVASVPNPESNAQRVRGITENRQAEKLGERREAPADAASLPPAPPAKPSLPLFDDSASSALDALVEED